MTKIQTPVTKNAPLKQAAAALAALLALAGCGSSSPVTRGTGAPVSAPSGTASAPGAPGGTPSPASASFRPRPTPSGTSTGAPAEPDFSGTGCYPDIPTPFIVAVSSDRTSYAPGEPVTLALDVRATAPSRVEHANAQEFDFALELRGEEVWRWSSVAPLIAPTHYERSYADGEVRRFTATWDRKYARSGRAALAGDYLLHGYFIGNMKTPAPPGRFICFDDAHLVLS